MSNPVVGQGSPCPVKKLDNDDSVESRAPIDRNQVRKKKQEGAAAAAAAAAKSLQLCPTLWDPIDGSPPGSTNPGDIYGI